MGFDALRSNGGAVRIRTVQPTDHLALQALNVASSDRSIYLRFFTNSRHAAEVYLAVLQRPASRDHHGLVAEVDGEIVGCAAFERCDSDSADIGLLVADAYQHEGIGTLLIEYLASIARHQGLSRFVADVLIQNGPMARALGDLGFGCRSSTEAGVATFVLDLAPTGAVLAAVDARDRIAEQASLRALLAPASVAVIGAGSRARSVGRQVLANILAGGYQGQLWVVNPKHRQVLGVRSYPGPSALPSAPDLAVIAVPAPAVIEAVTACGHRGARALLILSAGFGETGAAGRVEQDRLLRVARSFGMRVVGPNCLGLLNTDPAVSLNATFAPLRLTPGGLALISQSGALGIAVLRAVAECGSGVAQFVSVGNKIDVSSNDLLVSWEADPRIAVIALYLESFGNPAKFARIARRVAQRKPIVAIKAGRSEAGRRAGQSHTAAAAASDVVVDALFTQAGVLRVETMPQLIDTVRLLADLPLLAGPRVAIVGNSGGPGILAADTASAAGLQVIRLSDELRAELALEVPAAASTQNPVDLGAGAQPAQVQRAVEALIRSSELDAVLGVFTETLIAERDEIIAALGRAAQAGDTPLVVAQVGGESATLRLEPAGRPVPLFAFPEPAAAALGQAWRYARIRANPPQPPVRPAGLEVAATRAIVSELAERAEQHGVICAEGYDADSLDAANFDADDYDAGAAGWLPAADAARLLVGYGIEICPQRVVESVDEALVAAHELGFPVALKLADATVHKSEVGGVRTGLRTSRELRLAVSQLRRRQSGPLLVQPMVGAGTELILGGLQDPQFGPVLMVGAGGIFADLLGERAFRLAPLAEPDARAMIAQLRFGRLLDGYRGRPPVSRAALAELLVRFSYLIEDLPELAEIDLNPVICRAEQFLVVDAKIRLAAAALRPEQAVRTLREPAGNH
ncbi:MAG: bifunctional GNAT family N-acetyltransferase/acetate--CoA ligase family protein [Jatrophihabitantaceae bacterium]